MKKFVALLLALVLALSVAACAPSSGTGTNNDANNGTNSGENSGTNQTPEVPDYNKDLVLDADDKGVCPVCGGDPVQWTPIKDGKCYGEVTEAGHRHFYVAEDNITTEDGLYIWARNHDIDICLHLNNKTINFRGRIQTGYGNDLNVMGNGTVNYLADCTTDEENNKALFCIETANLTIYGGTYKSSKGAPIVDTPRLGIPMITLKGNANISHASVTHGSMTIDEKVVIDKLVAGDAPHPDMFGQKGKVWVARTFIGEVKSFAFPGEITDNKVPSNYGAAMGAFTGKISTADGVELTGAAGSLKVKAS